MAERKRTASILPSYKIVLLISGLALFLFPFASFLLFNLVSKQAFLLYFDPLLNLLPCPPPPPDTQKESPLPRLLPRPERSATSPPFSIFRILPLRKAGTQLLEQLGACFSDPSTLPAINMVMSLAQIWGQSHLQLKAKLGPISSWQMGSTEI